MTYDLRFNSFFGEESNIARSKGIAIWVFSTIFVALFEVDRHHCQEAHPSMR